MTLETHHITWLARLSRIAISAEENAAALTQINHFFKLVEQIQTVDTHGIEPLSHPLALNQSLAQPLREDVSTLIHAKDRDNYQTCAPSTADGFYLVPRVIE